MKSMLKLLLRPVLILAVIGCGSDENNPPPDADSERDSTTETENPTSSDEETDPEAACLSTISGQVVIEGAASLPVSVIVCIGACFEPISTDINGNFKWQLPIDGDFDCIPFAFERTPVRMDFVVASAPEAFAEYAFVTTPTQADISDLGDDDFDLDLGEMKLYALPDEAAVFSPASGADVSMFGLSYTLDKNALVKYDGDAETPPDHDQALPVFKAPLDEWNPPFVTTPLSALYFLGPRWARLAGDGVPLTIEAPTDLSDGDEVTVYLLGSYTPAWGDETVTDRPDFIYVDTEGHCINDNGALDLEWVEEGVFQACGRVTVQNGRITTPPIPRLTWVGIGR